MPKDGTRDLIAGVGGGGGGGKGVQFSYAIILFGGGRVKFWYLTPFWPPPPPSAPARPYKVASI